MTENTGSPAMTGHPAKWQILIAVMVGSIMGPLDGSIVNTVLPDITRYFDTDISIAQWVPSIYLLTISCLILLYGRLGDMIGYKKVFLCGLGTFTLTSILCGVSQSIWMLVAFRALQGLAAGMMMAVGFAIITSAFPPRERGKAMGMFAISIAIGLGLGPTLGGVIAEHLSWRYIFFINVPIGVAAMIMGGRIIPMGEKKPDQRLDWPGALAALIFLGCLTLYANRGEDWGWLSPTGITLLVIGLVFAVIFFIIERKSTQPMLNLSLFNNRAFSMANLSALLSFMALYAVIFLTPFFLVFVLQYSILKVGIVMVAAPAATLFVAPASGIMSDRIGTRLLTFLGMVITTVGLFALSSLDQSSGVGDVVWRLVIIGAGMGMFQSPNNSAVMGCVPPPYLGIASGILAAMRNVGMVLGLAVAGAVLYNIAPVTTTMKPGAFGEAEIAEFMDGLQWAFVAGAIMAGMSAIASLLAVDRKR
jgi:EmrB/QacA subfamily drug resistance transporter